LRRFFLSSPRYVLRGLLLPSFLFFSPYSSVREGVARRSASVAEFHFFNQNPSADCQEAPPEASRFHRLLTGILAAAGSRANIVATRQKEKRQNRQPATAW
jgi:hypothetical protein